MRADREAGFTLIEVVVVVAIVAVIAAATGTFFLGGATPAIATAGRDVTAAVDETRRAAIAYDAASLVFLPARSGSGYSARVYRGVPGEALFAAQNGPAYESTVRIAETTAPLGTPGFAFSIDRRGDVTGYANYVPGATTFTNLPCPAAGRFMLRLNDEREIRTVAIPCVLALSDAAPAVLRTPVPAWTPGPAQSLVCPDPSGCALAPLPPANPAGCPAGTAPDAALPGMCDGIAAVPTPSAAAPAATPTPCPNGFSGAAPACSGQMIERFLATADIGQSHTSTLFANGSLCDDGGCSLIGGPIDWNWGCPFAARAGASGVTVPHLLEEAFLDSTLSTIAQAFHDAAQNSGNGLVAFDDSYCTGFTAPNP